MSKIEINFNDPEIRKLLKRIKNENRTDPFAVDRTVAHLKAGILSLDDLKGRRKR